MNFADAAEHVQQYPQRATARQRQRLTNRRESEQRAAVLFWSGHENSGNVLK